MKSFYRIRAFVDGAPEESVQQANSAHEAMQAFETSFAPHNEQTIQSAMEPYPVEVAMVHYVTFGEKGPIFEDVTYQLNASRWARCSYEKALAYTQPNCGRIGKFVESIAALAIWDYGGDCGKAYNECEEPSEGHSDSHACLMAKIEEARRIRDGQQ